MENKCIWYVRGFEGIHLIAAMAFLEPVGVVNSPFWLSLSKFSETFLCNWHIFFHPLVQFHLKQFRHPDWRQHAPSKEWNKHSKTAHGVKPQKTTVI
jgi:hypothetical protein